MENIIIGRLDFFVFVVAEVLIFIFTARHIFRIVGWSAEHSIYISMSTGFVAMILVALFTYVVNLVRDLLNFHGVLSCIAIAGFSIFIIIVFKKGIR